jgi:hypothetical protein
MLLVLSCMSGCHACLVVMHASPAVVVAAAAAAAAAATTAVASTHMVKAQPAANGSSIDAEGVHRRTSNLQGSSNKC